MPLKIKTTMEYSQQVCCLCGSHPLYSLPLRKSSKGKGEALFVCFSVLTMCSDMGQAFVSFEGDVSLLFMVLVWRLAGELNQVISQKLVEVI